MKRMVTLRLANLQRYYFNNKKLEKVKIYNSSEAIDERGSIAKLLFNKKRKIK